MPRRSFGLCLGLLMIAGVSAADIPPELPMVPRLGVGARAMGMGGAWNAVGDDYSALSYNPAGLAQIQLPQLGAAFSNRSADFKTTYLGNLETSPVDKTRLHSLGFVFPFPTFRGSLVLGIAYHRVAAFDQDYFRKGSGPGVDFEEEEIIESGSLGSYQVGLGWDASPKLSLGLAATILSGSSDRERRFEFEASNGLDFESTITETRQDLSAISGTLGALYKVGRDTRVGLSIHLPENFNLPGDQLLDIIREDALGTDSVLVTDILEEFSFEDEIQIPFRISGGVSHEIGGLLLAGDFTYADWKEIDFDGPIRDRDTREFAYRSTFDLRFGAEYTLPKQPVRFRAGFISQPLAYQRIATDVFAGLSEEANFEKDARYFTLGAGALLDDSLQLDVAYLFGGYERSGRAGSRETIEEVQDQRLLISATFHMSPQGGRRR